MERETKWMRVEDSEAVRPYLPNEHKDSNIDVACVRILQYNSVTEFSQLLQITYKVDGEGKFHFTKHRIKHDLEEQDIKAKFKGIQTYINYIR